MLKSSQWCISAWRLISIQDREAAWMMMRNNCPKAFIDAECIVSRILIIGGDAFVDREIQTLLASDLHEVVLVKDSASGILELASSRFDLVIVNLLPAKMEGLALIARLRGLALKLPIIGVMGTRLSELMRPSLDFLDLAIEAGATYCLRRPLTPYHFLEVVNSSIGVSSGNQVAKRQQELSTEAPPNSTIAVFERAAVPQEMREALVVLRQYIEELGRESVRDPYTLDSLRDAIDCALTATEQACRIVEESHVMEIGGPEALDVTARGNRSLTTTRRRVLNSKSPGRGQLTPREREVLALVIDGVSNKAGGYRLSISVRTFEAHRANVMDKLGAKNAAELVRFGLEEVR
jgi:DNA-binding NarL/FixJ family response regulator